MGAEFLYEAIGEVRDAWILDAVKPRKRTRRSIRKPLLAACLTVVLLALPVGAELRDGYVSNLLAPLYGGAQTELVDSIGVPVDASVTVGDYTLTADAVIGDRYNIAIVYTLVRNDGGLLPEGIRFDRRESPVTASQPGISFLLRFLVRSLVGPGSGGGVLQQDLSEDGTKLQIVEQWTNSNGVFLTDRTKRVEFTDLVVWDRDSGEETLLAEGTWSLEFQVRYRDTTVKVPVTTREVHDENGNSYQLRKILLSPLGLHIDMTIPNKGEETHEMLQNFNVSIRLKSGAVIPMEDWNCGYSGKMEAATQKAGWGSMFDLPIQLEEIEALIICDATVPVDVK